MKEIRLGWPDHAYVTIHMDGEHVATMTSVDETGIPVPLLDLIRAAPDLLSAAVEAIDWAQGCDEDAVPDWVSAMAAAVGKAQGRM